MTKRFTKEEAALIFDNTLKAFGLKQDMKTNPQTLKKIIEEFRLDDFKTSNKRINLFFDNITSKPQKLSPLFENIKKGIISKHPAIVEFADLALKKNWFSQSSHVIYSVHVIYVLEILTAMMCNSHKFFIEAQDHYKAKEKMCGIDSKQILKSFKNTFKITRNLFGSIKSFLLDPGIIYFRLQRGLSKTPFDKNHLKNLYKNGTINYVEYKMLSPTRKKDLKLPFSLLRINIYEAGITEHKKGFVTNSISAHALSESIKNNPPIAMFKKRKAIPENNTDIFYESITEKENLFPVFTSSQDWASLYTSWNMAFTLGNVNDLDIMFPKLLIPSIINAKNDNFLGTRIISLWLSLKHYLFRKYDKKTVVGPSNKIEMVKAWSKINKKYALNLAKQETHEDSKTLLKGHKRFFSWPIYNLFKIIAIFIFKK